MLDQTKREELIKATVEAEFAMFDKVKNIGGRASCQDEWGTFNMMRRAQFALWDDDVLENYAEDVRLAANAGDNLIERKYAFMMKFTDPEYYVENLEAHMPIIHPGHDVLVEGICAIYRTWTKEAYAQYPYFSGKGRPAEGTEEEMVSADVYLRGELLTYSKITCDALHRQVKRCVAEGRNLVIDNYNQIAKGYGYENLDDCEAKLKARAQ